MKSSSHSIYLPVALARGLFLGSTLIFPTVSLADSNVEALSDNEASSVTIPSPPVVTAEDDIYSVFDSTYEEHRFRQGATGQFEAEDDTLGQLIQLSESNYRWLDENVTEHELTQLSAARE